nr:uncharacterized protein LOC113819614 [Penaeus vannamei]
MRFSSIKFVGSPNALNADTFTLYQGTYFSGMEKYTIEDIPDLGAFSNLASSAIVTGSSPWTLYSGSGYTGTAVCLYPDTDSISVNDQAITVGAHGQLAYLRPDNTSAQSPRGALQNIVKAELTPQGSSSNGAWGKFA